MADDSGATPPPSVPSGGRGRNAVFSFHVTGTPGPAPLLVAVEHRDAADDIWSGAGGVSIHADGTTMLRIDGLKEEWQLRFAPGSGAGDVQVHMPPPRWLPD